MQFLLAIVLYLLTLFSVLQGWLIISFCSILFFSFLYSPIYLIALAILIDGYMGSFYSMPVLSLCSVVWFVVVEFLRPKVIDFNNQ